MATKQTILKEKLNDYLKAGKAAKSEILNQLESITGFNRKAIIRRFKTLQFSDSFKTETRGRPVIYDSQVTVSLKEIWLLFGQLCAERLQPQLAEYVRVLKKDGIWSYDQQTTKLLLEMSLGTVKNRLAYLAGKNKVESAKASTKPSLIKEIIPIRRGPWRNPLPGFGEIDTVAHCGISLKGDYAYSVQYTDVSTIWTCLSAQWGKGEKATVESIERIKNHLPFDLLGLDPDSGGEFINWHLLDWSKKQRPVVQLTRTRPYKKNDHGRIEQKNYTNIRKYLVYARLDDPAKVKLMNQLYDLLEDYINFFLPSMKCLKKERTGSNYKRVYDRPKTAYQRVIEHPDINQTVKNQLKTRYAILKPKILKEQLDQLINRILKDSHY